MSGSRALWESARSRTHPAPPPITSSGALPELLSPAEAAKALGVSEGDVLSALSEGSLKGKKIADAERMYGRFHEVLTGPPDVEPDMSDLGKLVVHE